MKKYPNLITVYITTLILLIASCAEITRIGQVIVDTLDATPIPTVTVTPVVTPIITVTPSPIFTPTETPISTPTVMHNVELQKLIVPNTQLSLAINQMNTIIDMCNAQPDICKETEAIIRLNNAMTALSSTIQYIEFLESE